MDSWTGHNNHQQRISSLGKSGQHLRVGAHPFPLKHDVQLHAPTCHLNIMDITWCCITRPKSGES
eukprot:353839-Chlamydomonas_euryale.AAC.8